MSEHKAKLTWSRGDAGFGYKEFPREHEWTFDNGQTVRASAAVDFLGKPGFTDPEEAYTAALTSCHLLTFLAIASMSGYTVDAYEDEAVGHLEKAEDGKPWLARVEMHPRIAFSGEKQPTPDQLNMLHQKAHKECFLARSVKTEVTW
jgi:organic hydroperoxide reductase OsmC/OhrA